MMMTMYKQYNKNGELVTHKDLQAKTAWCRAGESLEEAFVSRFGKQFGVRINPAKRLSEYDPDLLQNDGRLADLKTQNTPFFKARELYNLDPTYTVVFNEKDIIRYSKKYPNIMIYFWVEWRSVKFVKGDHCLEVDYLNGVYRVPFQKLKEALKDAPKHYYSQRKNDTKGNAKASFLIDLRSEIFENMEKTFKCIIAGGRDFNNYDWLKEVCDKILANKENVEIVSGAAYGADLLGEKYAKERGYKLKRFPAQWEEHGKSAGYIRNTEMAEYADALIAFWDGQSKGTMHMINIAEEKGLLARVKKYSNPKVVTKPRKVTGIMKK